MGTLKAQLTGRLGNIPGIANDGPLDKLTFEIIDRVFELQIQATVQSR